MKKYGCIGKKLTHSFSKEVHSKLADYDYEIIELSEEEIKPFFEKKNFEAINVTIPYKETVIEYLDFISDIAEKIGAVNTVVNRDGKLYGYNTDYYGMKALIEKIGIDLKGKKVLILGTGGTSKTAQVVSKDLGALDIRVVSRNKKENCITYEEAIKECLNWEIIINTTPLGMYPDCDSRPIDISKFTSLEGVVDTVYNPLTTSLVSDAKKKGIKAGGGLYMLVMQAIVAVEKFLDIQILKEAADDVFRSILATKENIILTGMPGSGKSTVGKLLQIDGFEFIDTDAEIEKRCGCSIKELIKTKGEKYFRNLESEVVHDVSSKTCRIISTGGGAILRQENVNCLKRNGKLFFIDADIKRLRATDDRPFSDTNEKLEKLYFERIGIYEATADIVVPDMDTPKEEAEYILTKRLEQIL